MPDLTLTRAEAVAVESLLIDTCGCFTFARDMSTREGVAAVIRRLTLEAAIRDGGGWWGAASPAQLDLLAQLGEASCPDEFTLTADGAAALVELLPLAAGDTLAEDIDTVRALADRLGVAVTA